MEKLTVLKAGGAIIEDPPQLDRLLKQFAEIKGKKILVHGGGRKATVIAAAMGMECRMVNGRRITDKAMLDVVTMVYGGLVNKNITARLQASGIKAVGITGADMGIITACKRPPTKMTNEAGEEETVDFGYVGDVEHVDGESITFLTERGITPVIAPLTYDTHGSILNTNADTVAAEVATALAKYYDVSLVFAFEKKGVLRNENDENSVIPVITRREYKQYAAVCSFFVVL